MIGCWKVTVETYEKLAINKMDALWFESSNFAVRCIAFAGYNSLTHQTYWPKLGEFVAKYILYP